MRKNLLYLAIVTIILVGGIYFVRSANKTAHHGETSNNTPMAQSHSSYKITLVSATESIKPHQEVHILYKITDNTGATVKNFVLDHTKLMHFIAVRMDLQEFQHLHPEFNESTGEFTVPITFPVNGKYRLFADFIPANGQKDAEGNPLAVTPYKDITVGDTQYVPQEVTPDTEIVKTAGEYTFTYTLPKSLQAGTPVSLGIHVTKNGQPVTDMEEYLGAQAHGILLKKETLEFAHLHAMGEEMSHMMGGKRMTMHGPMPKGPEILTL